MYYISSINIITSKCIKIYQTYNTLSNNTIYLFKMAFLYISYNYESIYIYIYIYI